MDSTSFVNVLAVNAVLASVLALGATALGRWIRNPYLRHLLWTVVLLKFVTPPLVQIGVPIAAPAPVPHFAEIHWEFVERAALDASEPAFWSWPRVILMIWAVGSLLWIGLLFRRMGRFQRSLRQTSAASEEQVRMLHLLSDQFGVVRPPELRLTGECLPPLLWVVPGRRVLLLPERLLSNLDESKRRALFAHELAHLARGDYWFRALELLVLAGFWWCPVAWWACRQLRQAEEQCCDARVLEMFPAHKESYALALVDTLDFLAESPMALPVAASGFGSLQVLRSRFDMILAPSQPRRGGLISRLALLTLALTLLPWAPSFSQEISGKIIINLGPDGKKLEFDFGKPAPAQETPRAEARPPKEAAHAIVGAGQKIKIIIQGPDGNVKELDLSNTPHPVPGVPAPATKMLIFRADTKKLEPKPEGKNPAPVAPAAPVPSVPLLPPTPPVAPQPIQVQGNSIWVDLTGEKKFKIALPAAPAPQPAQGKIIVVGPDGQKQEFLLAFPQTARVPAALSRTVAPPQPVGKSRVTVTDPDGKKLEREVDPQTLERIRQLLESSKSSQAPTGVTPNAVYDYFMPNTNVYFEKKIAPAGTPAVDLLQLELLLDTLKKREIENLQKKDK